MVTRLSHSGVASGGVGVEMMWVVNWARVCVEGSIVEE